MRRTTVVVLVPILLVLGGGCSDEGGDAGTSTTTTDPTASTTEPGRSADSDDPCAVLQGTERSKIPDALEHRGLDGSLRFLRQRSGPDIDGDVLVYLEAEHASRLDELASGPVSEIEGVEVLATRSQAEVFDEFQQMFGDGVRDSVSPEILPAVIAVQISGDAARADLEALREEPWANEVIFRDEFAARLMAYVGLVHEQFGEELGALTEAGPDIVREAARQLLALEATASSVIVQPTEVIHPLEVLIAFVDDECPSRPLPDPLAP